MKKFLDTCRRLLSIALNLFVLCAEPIALPLSWEMGSAHSTKRFRAIDSSLRQVSRNFLIKISSR